MAFNIYDKKHPPDPLGRRTQLPRTATNRAQVDRVCDWVLDSASIKAEFLKKPSANHVYFDAYSVIFGMAAAGEMLRKVWK